MPTSARRPARRKLARRPFGFAGEATRRTRDTYTSLSAHALGHHRVPARSADRSVAARQRARPRRRRAAELRPQHLFRDGRPTRRAGARPIALKNAHGRLLAAELTRSAAPSTTTRKRPGPSAASSTCRIGPRSRRPSRWACRDGAIFTFTLVQQFGGGRTIGRLRLSALTGDLAQSAIAGRNRQHHAPACAAAFRRSKPSSCSSIACAQDRDVREVSEPAGRHHASLGRLTPATTLVMQELPQAAGDACLHARRLSHARRRTS